MIETLGNSSISYSTVACFYNQFSTKEKHYERPLYPSLTDGKIEVILYLTFNT